MKPETTNRQVFAVHGLKVDVTSGSEVTSVVEDASFEVAAGELVALIGRSGAGKSTIARGLLGLLPERDTRIEGRLRIDGSELELPDAGALNRIRGSQVGFVPQDSQASLTPVKRVGSLLAEVLDRHRRLTVRERDARVLQLLEEVDLADPERVSASYAHELSGGMQQRVSIALALAPEPSILIADEPTSALDSTTQLKVLELIRKLRAGRDLAVLLLTHDLAAVSRFADRIILVDEGRVVLAGPVDELLGTDPHPLVRDALEKFEPEDRPAISPDAANLLEVRGLALEFGRAGDSGGPARRPDPDAPDAPLDLMVRRGEKVALVGGSGSGKTTLARTIVGLHAPDHGSIVFEGETLTGLRPDELRPFRRRIGMVFQDSASAFNPRHSIGRSVMGPLIGTKGLNREEKQVRARKQLDRVGLGPGYFARLPHQLSGGERQRAALARSLVADPRLLICDELLSGLDGVSQRQILELLSEIVELTGLSCLFITHDLGTAGLIADRVAVMHDGRIVETGDVREVFEAPGHPHTVELVRAALFTAVPAG